MALINDNRYRVTGTGILNWINSRPALIISLINLILMFLFISTFKAYDNIIMPAFLLIIPAAPSIILENKWVQTLKSDHINTSHFFNVVKANRRGFILAGYILSFIISILSYFFLGLFYEAGLYSKFLDITYHISYKSLFTIIFATMIAAFVLTASFYRVRAEDYDSGKRYNFISSPSQVVLLTSYSLIGIFTTPLILWLGNMTFSSISERRGMNIETITDFSFTYTLIIITTLFLSIAYLSDKIPELVYHAQYRFPDRKRLIQFVAYAVIYTLIVGSIIQYRSFLIYDYQRSDIGSFDRLLIGSILLIYVFISLGLQTSGETCRDCNLILIDDRCVSCDGTGKITLPLQLRREKMILHPQCPYCGEKWRTLNKKCATLDCKFVIDLHCEYCGAKLNPLWNSCVKCKRSRETIVQKALKAPGSEGFVRTVTYFRLIIALIIPVIIHQIKGIVTLVLAWIDDEGRFSPPPAVLYQIFYSITRVIIFIVVILMILSLLLVQNNEHRRSLGLIASRIALVPGSIFMLSGFLFFVFDSWDAIELGLKVKNLFQIITFSISLLFFYFMIRGNFRLLKSFRPVVPFNPKLAMDRRTSD